MALPVVLIPGIQGRWEWMRPAVDALSKQCRVITFSLADEPTSGARFDESAGVWSYVQQVADVLDTTGVRNATICGVSYGGLIAAAFAARHPDKVSALVLVVGDSAVVEARRARRVPHACAAAAVAALLHRLAAHVSGDLRGERDAAWRRVHRAARRQLFSRTCFRRRLMARRARMVASLDCRSASSRTSVARCWSMTGESTLDRVVPVGLTREYHRIWPHATEAVLQRTGHLGLITRPEEFATLVASFAVRTRTGPRPAGAPAAESAPAESAGSRSTMQSVHGGMRSVS